MIRVCQGCGQPFQGAGDRYFCGSCAAKIKSAGAVRARTCIDCGASFDGGPRARRCPACRQEARVENSRKCRREGTARPLGSIDRCEACGEEYAVKSGRQKYCPGCQREASLRWQRGHKKDYNKKPGVAAQKSGRRMARLRLCAYCGRPYSSGTSTTCCSDYCRAENAKLRQCRADIKRGEKRDLGAYLSRQEAYRESVRQA